MPWYWRWTEQRLGAGYAAWAVERRAAGWTVEARPVARRRLAACGHPHAAERGSEGGRVHIPGGFSWSAERAVLRVALLLPPDAIDCRRGRATPEIGGLSQIPYTADRLDATVPVGTWARRRKGRTSGRAISRAGTCRPEREAARRLTVGFLQARLEIRPSAPQGEPALAFAISAEGIGLPPGTRWPLGSRISSLSVEGALNGPVPRAAGIGRIGPPCGGTAEERWRSSISLWAGDRSGCPRARPSRSTSSSSPGALPTRGWSATPRPWMRCGQRRHHAPRRYRREGDPELDRAGARERRLRPGRSSAHLAGPHSLGAPNSPGPRTAARLARGLRQGGGFCA